jgi:hypothetical protein
MTNPITLLTATFFLVALLFLSVDASAQPLGGVRQRATVGDYQKAADIAFGDIATMQSQWRVMRSNYIFAPAFVISMERTVRNPNLSTVRRFAVVQERFTGNWGLVD